MNTDNLLPVALDLLAKSSGMLLLAFAVNSTWRSSSAAQRCLVWGVAFGVLLLLPFSVLVPPRWSIALELPQPSSPPTVTTVHFGESPALVEEVAAVPLPAVRRFPDISPVQLALGTWIGGMVLVLGRRLLGGWNVRRLRWQCRMPEDGRVHSLMTGLVSELGVRRHITLYESGHVSAPMTWGAFRPVLLLPAGAASWSDAALKAALRHELGHIRHCDAPVRLLTCMVTAFLWPNVLVWLASKVWRMAQEQACDDLVLRGGASCDDYAMQLLDAARGMGAGAFHRAPVMAMARPSTLEARIAAIMDPTRNRRPPSKMFRAAGAITALLALAACAVAQVRNDDSAKNVDASKEVIALNVRVLEVPAGTTRSLLGVATPKPGTGIVLGATQSKGALRKLLVAGDSKTVSYPHMTTISGKAATIRSVVNIPYLKPPVRYEPVGTIISITPTLQNDGKIKLLAEAALSELTGERKEGDVSKPKVRGRKAEAEVVFRSDSTVMLMARPDWKDNRDTLIFITPERLGEAPITQTKPPDDENTDGRKPVPRQVFVQSKFIEIAGGTADADFLSLTKATLNAEEMQALTKALAQKRGVDLLSAPSVTTRSGQNASVEIVRELVYPEALEADGKTPKAFTMKPVGIMLQAKPFALKGKEGGPLTLSLVPMVRELVGWKSDATPGQIFRKIKDLPKGNRLATPVFSERTASREVALAPGEWAVLPLNEMPGRFMDEREARAHEHRGLLLSDVKTFDAEKDYDPNRRIWCLVSAKEIIDEKTKTSSGTKP